MKWYRHGLPILELDQLIVLDRMEPIVNEPGWPSLLQPPIRVPKALTTFAVSLVFFLAALPAHAQQQGGIDIRS